VKIKNNKVTIDTNILISAFVFPDGIVREIINLTIKKQIEIFISEKIIEEYIKILSGKFHWTDEDIKENLIFLKKIFNIIKTEKKIDIIKNDEADNRILECAITAGTNFILTGDKHLLNIKKYKNISILKPADFMRLMF